MTAAMAQASASLAERSVTAKGYFAHASCRRTGGRGSMTSYAEVEAGSLLLSGRIGA